MEVDLKIKSPDLDKIVNELDHLVHDLQDEPVTCDCFGGIADFFSDLYHRIFD